MGLTFFTLIFFISSYQVHGYDDSNCCSKVEDKCRFICSNTLSNNGSLYDNVMCASSQIQYFSCKLNIDMSGGMNLASVVDNVTNTVEKNWSNINDTLKILMSNKELFSKLTIKQLSELPQDILVRLKSLPGMTEGQFNGILHNLNNFTPDDLKMFLDKVDTAIIFSNLTALSKDFWNKIQLQLIAETALKEFGSHLQNWTSKEIGSIGNFVSGLPSVELLQLSSKTFEQSLEKLCNVELFHVQQKIAMLTPAMKLFGTVDNWNDIVITRMCQFLMSLSVEDMLMIKAKEIIGSLSALQKYINESQKDVREVILTKIQEVWGEVSKWTVEQITSVGNLINGINVTDIESLNMEQILGFIQSVDEGVLDKVQLAALSEKLSSVAMENWPSGLIEKVGQLFGNLAEVIENQPLVLTKLTIIPFLEATKGIEWTQKQARMLLNKIKEMEKSSKLSAEDMKNMGSIMKAMTSGEIAKMARDNLFKNLPNIAMVTGLGEPVLRFIIKVHKEETRNNGGIRSLGNFVMALTRYDMEGLVIDNILSNLDAYKQMYFNEVQNLQMIEKLEKVLGKIKQDGNSDSTQHPWGYDNVVKMGNVPSVLTKTQFLDYPMNALESVIELLGKDDRWKADEVFSVMKRMKTYWSKNNRKFSDLKEFDIEMLGKFVQGFMIQDIWTMTKEVQLLVWKKLGEFSGLSAEKLKTRANAAYETLKNLADKDGLFNQNTILTMGNLLAGLTKDTFMEINPELIKNNLNKLVDIPDMPAENLRAIFEIVKNKAGVSIDQWTADQWRRFGKALQTLNIEEILAISADSFRYVIDLLGTFDGWTDEQINAVMAKVKNVFGQDVSKWSFKTFSKLGTFINHLGSGDLEKINANILVDVVDLFEHASNTTVKALAGRIMNEVLKNDITNLNITIIKSIRNILEGFDANVLQNIDFNSPDILSEFGKVENWSSSQLRVLLSKADEYMKNSNDPENFLYLGNLAKGMTADMIQQMSAESFRIAAGVLGKINGFTKEQKSALAAKAKEAWGDDVGIWTAAMIKEANQIIDGLLAVDLAKINPAFVSWIPANILSQMDVEKIIAFTKYQLLSFTEEQIKAVNQTHFKQLPTDIVQTLTQVIDENQDRPQFAKMTDYVVNDEYYRSSSANSLKFNNSSTVLILFTTFVLVFKFKFIWNV